MNESTSQQENYRNELLTWDQEQMLGQRISAGDDSAKEDLVMAHMRFVYKLAGFYSSNNCVDRKDLIQVGYFALRYAAGKHDFNMGTRFLSYASYKVRSMMIDFINDNSRVTRKRKILSLDDRGATDDNSRSLGEFLVDEETPDPYTVSDVFETISQVREKLESCRLKELEQNLIDWSYGLNGRDILSDEKIAKNLGRSQTWVRKIRMRVLHRFKAVMADLA